MDLENTRQSTQLKVVHLSSLALLETTKYANGVWAPVRHLRLIN